MAFLLLSHTSFPFTIHAGFSLICSSPPDLPLAGITTSPHLLSIASCHLSHPSFSSENLNFASAPSLVSSFLHAYRIIIFVFLLLKKIHLPPSLPLHLFISQLICCTVCYCCPESLSFISKIISLY